MGKPNIDTRVGAQFSKRYLVRPRNKFILLNIDRCTLPAYLVDGLLKNGDTVNPIYDLE